GESASIEQKATPCRVSVSSKDSHDLAIVVEVNGERCDSIRKIERGEDSIIVKKSTIMPVRKRLCHVVIEVESDDLPDVVYSARSRESRFRKRYGNREKLARIPKKTMKNTIGVRVIPYALLIIVHADRLRHFCAEEIS